ncbi:MAG: tetratricopeptide repeat protein [Treponema sp.]|jgi:Flp pilus assembly protein TadD|nr:tetratricopeptide repeat protein [Treponema sp.]
MAYYNNRGAAYAGKGNNDRAIVDLNQALRLNSNFAEARNNLEELRKQGH